MAVSPIQARPLTPAAPAASSRAEALSVGAFFQRYPSLGGQQVALFHAFWAEQGTFATHPLQAYLYHQTVPVGAAGKPNGPAWQAYANAVDAGLPAADIERAFLDAHLDAFRRATATPEFRRLYAQSDDGYRKVVDAYLDTLAHVKDGLAAGKSPVALSRNLFSDTNACLWKRRAPWNGFMATAGGVASALNPLNPLTQQVARGAWTIFKGMLGFTNQAQPAPTRVRLTLTAAQARDLAAQTGLKLKAGSQDLTEADFQGATFQEAPRFDEQRPAPRYPLLLSDFTAAQKLHGGQRMAGPDGVLDGAEVAGVLRQAQARARSQLVKAFFDTYPAPEAGILVYSANMLAMTGSYGQSEMFGTLANAIMPMDRAGKPKNAFWQAYADAYDRHKASGQPSMEVLEGLWFRAHMEDFKVVDTPAFQAQLKDFWAAAGKDKAMQPMAVYTQAMVGGRIEFEKATAAHLSDDAAFAAGFTHFAKTVASSGSFPFWQQDLKEAFAWAKDPHAPSLDARGLPTDHGLFERAVSGITMMGGLKRIMGSSVAQRIQASTTHRPATGMIDLSKVLSAAQLAQLDPKVAAFYQDPRAFDISTGVDFDNTPSTLVLGALGPAVSGLGNIPDKGKGFEGYPLESELYKDLQGRTHWDRYVVVEGKRQPLFLARFETAGKQLKETFTVDGKDVALYFDVAVVNGGLQLTIDHKQSSLLAVTSNIVFTTIPTATGVQTTGRYQCIDKIVKGAVTFRMTPKATA
ncbi:MAG: hypothetical protein JWM80_2697 [Cyanobacteria bacterium RYN_339]|nr:hypothetical protein [Cyanobacteria bacterium RYN_339]